MLVTALFVSWISVLTRFTNISYDACLIDYQCLIGSNQFHEFITLKIFNSLKSKFNQLYATRFEFSNTNRSESFSRAKTSPAKTDWRALGTNIAGVSSDNASHLSSWHDLCLLRCSSAQEPSNFIYRHLNKPDIEASVLQYGQKSILSFPKGAWKIATLSLISYFNIADNTALNS